MIRCFYDVPLRTKHEVYQSSSVGVEDIHGNEIREDGLQDLAFRSRDHEI